MSEYRDQYGYLHDRIKPKHDDTTNFPLYDATEIILGVPAPDRDLVYLRRSSNLFRDNKWHSSAVINDGAFSLDNSLGVVCGMKTLMSWYPKDDVMHIVAKKNLKKIPYFHWQNKHPEGLILTWYAKTKLAWPLLWIPFISMIYGALTPHELNKAAGDGSYQPKTSTHILTILWCVALDLKFTRWCYEKIVLDKWIKPPHSKENFKGGDTISDKCFRWKWMEWWAIFLEYYKDENHPNVIASRNL